MDKIRVLIIEDDMGDADFIRTVLSEEGNQRFDLKHATSLKAGLEILDQGNIDIVLLDMVLPDSSGLNTFSKAHDHAPAVPIVILSGFEDEPLVLEAVRRGAQDYLAKRYVDGKLLSRVMLYAIERKKVEASLTRLASFPELSPNPILEVDEAGHLTYFNPAARVLFPELADQSHENALVADIKAALETLLGQPQKTLGREVPVRDRFYEQHLSYLTERKVIRSYVVDITERKQLERWKDDFVSIISHELRTPLSIVKQGISLLVDEVPGSINLTQKKVLTVSRDNIDRLARMINNLLDISKLRAGGVQLVRERVDLCNLIRQIALSFENMASQKGIAIKVNVSSEKLEICADSDKVIQIFTNLVGNAMKFTEKGHIEISAVQKELFVECRVSDTGMGIAQENLSRVFGRFQQFGRTPGAGEKGTGLGLAITKGLVELHRGDIHVESEFGKGTSFVFTLPTYTLENSFKLCMEDAVKDANAHGSKVSVMRIAFLNGDPAHKPSLNKIEALIQESRDKIQSGLSGKVSRILPDPAGLAVVLMNCEPDGLVKMKTHLQKVFTESLIREFFPGEVKWECGCATYPDEAKDVDELIRKAEVPNR